MKLLSRTSDSEHLVENPFVWTSMNSCQHLLNHPVALPLYRHVDLLQRRLHRPELLVERLRVLHQHAFHVLPQLLLKLGECHRRLLRPCAFVIGGVLLLGPACLLLNHFFHQLVALQHPFDAAILPRERRPLPLLGRLHFLEYHSNHCRHCRHFLVDGYDCVAGGSHGDTDVYLQVGLDVTLVRHELSREIRKFALPLDAGKELDCRRCMRKG